MIASLSRLQNVKKAPAAGSINLLTGEMASITHIGDLHLQNGLFLKDVLYVPTFKHNLLSIHELSQDNGCHVQFYSGVCKILMNETDTLVAMDSWEMVLLSYRCYF